MAHLLTQPQENYNENIDLSNPSIIQNCQKIELYGSVTTKELK